MKIEIWEEGFVIQGNDGQAQFLGSFEAESFDDAVEQYNSTADFYLDNFVNPETIAEEEKTDQKRTPNAEGIGIPDFKKLTRGQIAVGLTFNPSRNPLVDLVKQKCADAIDAIENFRDNVKGDTSPVQGEKLAQSQIAIRDIQSGQMWAVKAITLEPQQS